MPLLARQIPLITGVLALLSLPGRPALVQDDPDGAVRAAVSAVRGDSTEPMRRRMQSRLDRDPADRDAALALATIARLTYDHEDADRRYRALFADSTRADRHAIRARIGLALGLESQGQSGTRVLDLYRTALAHARELGDPVLEGAVLFRIGSLLAPFAGAGPALAYLDSAMQALPPVAAPDIRANVRCRRAQILIATAGPGAEDSLRLASEFARTGGDPDALGFCLRAEGVLYRLRGEGDSAEVAQEALIELRRRIRDRSGLAVALTIRADQLRAGGDFGGSLRLFREAAAEARASGNHYIEATVTLGLGGNALALNDHAMARDNVHRAIEAFEAAEDSASLMLARSFLPFVSMAAGDLERAREQTLAVLPFWRRHGDWLHVSDLERQLAVIEMRAGNYDAAERALDASAEAARRVSSPGSLGAVEYDRGRLALKRGDLTAAERGFGRFLSSVAPDEHLLRYDGRVRLAEVYARRGELARAEGEMVAAGDALDAWRAGLTDPQMRSLAFQASGFEANDRNASVAVVLAALASGGRADAALALAERRRARELAEGMARVSALNDERNAAVEPARGGNEATAPRSASAARPLGVSELADALPDDSIAILELVTGGGGAPTTLFVLARDSGTPGVRAYVLPAADSLVDDIARLLALLERGDDPRALERRLGAVLLDSALAELPVAVTRLVLVPDGPLHRVPWDALRLAGERYVAERFVVSVAPSASVLAALWGSSEGSDREPISILAIGNPTSAADAGADSTLLRAFQATGGLPRLPHAEREARMVARYGADAELRVGNDATGAFLRRAPLDRFDIVHIAAHAVVDDRVTTRTALALAPSDGEAGFVTAAHLASLDLDVDLVVLSACRSAGGVVVDGEGMQGLTAPLLRAGARSIVATSWRIDDRATVDVIGAFYDALSDGAAVADALRAAKLDAIARGAPPRDWAALTAIGDPLVRVDLTTPRRSVPWTLLGVLVGGAVAFLAIRRRVSGGR